MAKKINNIDAQEAAINDLKSELSLDIDNLDIPEMNNWDNEDEDDYWDC